jgi:hypothetical protein
MWRHDIFKITVDQFWKVGTDALCRSVDIAGRSNHFNGTDVRDLNNLNCAVSGDPGSQVIWIYGLDTMLDMSVDVDY